MRLLEDNGVADGGAFLLYSEQQFISVTAVSSPQRNQDRGGLSPGHSEALWNCKRKASFAALNFAAS